MKRKGGKGSRTKNKEFKFLDIVKYLDVWD